MIESSLSRSFLHLQETDKIADFLRQALHEPERQSAAIGLMRGMLGKNSPLYLLRELHPRPIDQEQIDTYAKIAQTILCEKQRDLLALLPRLLTKDRIETAKDLYFILAKYLPRCSSLQPQSPLLLLLLTLYLGQFQAFAPLSCQASCRYRFALLYRTLYPHCTCEGKPFELTIDAPTPFEPDWEQLYEKIIDLKPLETDEYESITQLFKHSPDLIADAILERLRSALSKVQESVDSKEVPQTKTMHFMSTQSILK